MTRQRWIGLIVIAITRIFAANLWSGEDYRRYFDASWHATIVGEGESTLAAGSPDSACHVKGYGWKLLSTERRKPKDTSWFSLGDVWQKWGWKMVVHNPKNAPVEVEIHLDLKSADGFVLDSRVFGLTPLQPPGWVKPEETEVFQDTSAYNTTQHKGEGEPVRLAWRIGCRTR
ncbi:MAG: hypothetical protein ACRERE_38575 [Candidatus Entotheonellia bacterium]